METTQWVLGVLMAIALPSATSFAEHGTAAIAGTSEGSSVTGHASFEDTEQGLRVSVDVSHVPPGAHGFHIHEFGRCDEAGKAAGSHYNPRGVPHGDLLKGGLGQAHAGDLGNIEIDAQGHGSFERIFPGIRLSEGQDTVAGRSVILHEKADDFSQPAGNSGARIGCGVIVLGPQAAQH